MGGGLVAHYVKTHGGPNAQFRSHNSWLDTGRRQIRLFVQAVLLKNPQTNRTNCAVWGGILVGFFSSRNPLVANNVNFHVHWTPKV